MIDVAFDLVLYVCGNFEIMKIIIFFNGIGFCLNKMVRKFTYN